MGNIVLLDELTINKIAAGEVIERPASVVKELMENSIDAGATKITVEVKNGGISQIRIIDDGHGMKADDLEIAFERHATSKIRKADDLEVIKSMGFRGEALASIAAIANVEMISKVENEEIGNKIVVEAGNVLEKEESGTATGTTINVKNLFFNTPVRYKFLKKDYTELGYIEDVVTRVALANPNIAIKLLNENKTIIQTNGDGQIKNVIYNIYGKDVAEGILEVDYTYEDIRVKGVVGKPEIARNNRAYQMFFVNNRYIKNQTLSAGAEQGFKGLLQIGKFGFLILKLEIDPSKIDVNVHPAKLEIRFEEEQKVFKAVYHSIRETLLKADLIKNVSLNPKESKEIKEEIPKISSNINQVVNKEEVDKVEESTNKNTEEIAQNNIADKTIKIPGFVGLFKRGNTENIVPVEKIESISDNTKVATVPNPIEELYNKKNGNKNQILQDKTDYMVEMLDNKKEDSKIDTSEKFSQMYKNTFGKISNEKPERYKDVENLDGSTLKDLSNVSVFEDKEVYDLKPNYKYIGSMFSTYIVIEIDDDVYIIDQHAAHERIMYEKVKQNFYTHGEKDSQIMLLPDIITLTHKEKDIVKENTELFEKAGFTFEEFGENTIRLIGVPTICIELDTKELFKEILDEINTVAITALQEKEEKFISTIACKSAVKANMKLSTEEVETLMDKLLRLRNPFTCPHGRPTAIKMTKADIEKKFGRRK